MTEEFPGEELNPDARQLLASIPKDQKFAVINLLRYHDEAVYSPGTVTKKLSGRQAYKRYADLSVPFLKKVGGVPMWRGDLAALLIGPEIVPWDEILIVQYPSRTAFESMLDDPEYKKILFHRTAAVRDSRLVGAASPELIGPMKWKLFTIARSLTGS